MCYIKSANVLPVSAGAAAAAAKNTQQQQQQQQKEFAFPDLNAFGNENAWLTGSELPFDITSTDFLPWLESIAAENANPSFDFLAPQSATVSMQAVQPETLEPMPLTASPMSSAGELIKAEPTHAYLPSPPASSFGMMRESPFPSLMQKPFVGGSSCSASSSGEEGASSLLFSPPETVSPQSSAFTFALLPPDLSAAADEIKTGPVEKKKRKAETGATKTKTLTPHVASKKRPPAALDDSCDEDEQVTAKRQKNTEAARRSRARKTAKLESLESEVSLLERDKSALLVRLAVLESEASSFVTRENELNRRIQMLERQLEESHKALMMGVNAARF